MIRPDVTASHTWGSSARVKLVRGGSSQSQQLASINLPEPALCTAYFQATIVKKLYTDDVVWSTTLNLTEGIGRVAVPRTISFLEQPALFIGGPYADVAAPIEFTLPNLPVHSLQVDVSTSGLIFSGRPDAVIEIEYYFILSPVTRIALKTAPLDFGMATPGEANAADDELRSELEEDAPSVQAIMAGEAVAAEDDSDDGADELDERRSFALHVAQQLQRRFGRRPSREELRAALARIAARNARRRRRA